MLESLFEGPFIGGLKLDFMKCGGGDRWEGMAEANVQQNAQVHTHWWVIEKGSVSWVAVLKFCLCLYREWALCYCSELGGAVVSKLEQLLVVVRVL